MRVTDHTAHDTSDVTSRVGHTDRVEDLVARAEALLARRPRAVHRLIRPSSSSRQRDARARLKPKSEATSLAGKSLRLE